MNLNKDFLKGILAGFVLSLFVIYSFFRIYWLMEVGLKYLRWHAVLWLYVSIALVFAGISYMLYKRGVLKTEGAKKKYTIALGLFMGWYIAELALRLAGIGATYTELNEGVFVNPTERMQKTWYKKHEPNSTYTLQATEFLYVRGTNSLGFSDTEWSLQKDTGEIRLLTLGDSFTEGDGCDSNEAYPRVLQGLLQQQFPQNKITVLNAGICGSDPYFEYKKLTDLLLPYQPDIVVYTNGTNDLFFDHIIYGGLERFKPDSTIQLKIPAYSWLGLYEVSYVFRQLIGIWYNETFISLSARRRDEPKALADARNLSSQFSQLAVQHNFECMQLLRPENWEIEDGHERYNPEELTAPTDTLSNYHNFNLLTYYRDTLHINKEKAAGYFWHINHHHNARGYAAMAQAVAAAVQPLVQQKIKTLK